MSGRFSSECLGAATFSEKNEEVFQVIFISHLKDYLTVYHSSQVTFFLDVQALH